jgi:glycosyltransferase involved in cell wall biosynthesis
MGEFQEPPMVTLALFAYNQEKFIREAVEAVLGQAYKRLEIIISDDCSKDKTFDIINSLVSNYTGPHEIIVNRNSVNLGLAKHFNKIVAMARGEIIVVAAGDDISLPMRVAKTVEMFRNYPEANFASFTDAVINEEGIIRQNNNEKADRKVSIVTLKDYISGRTPPLSGASRGYRKKVFEVFGELNVDCPTEDTPSILRCLMLGHGLVSTEGGILYRQHDLNLSGPTSLHKMKFGEIKAQYLRDLALAQIKALISHESKSEIEKWIEKNFQYRVISKKLHEKSSSKISLISDVVVSRYFDNREKLSLLWQIILGP